jgi:hypothetical protein
MYWDSIEGPMEAWNSKMDDPEARMKGIATSISRLRITLACLKDTLNRDSISYLDVANCFADNESEKNSRSLGVGREAY